MPSRPVDRWKFTTVGMLSPSIRLIVSISLATMSPTASRYGLAALPVSAPVGPSLSKLSSRAVIGAARKDENVRLPANTATGMLQIKWGVRVFMIS